MTYNFRRPPYHIGSDRPLAQKHINTLLANLESAKRMPQTGLSGRTGVRRIHLEDIGKVVIKQYFRGGLLRHFNRRTYFWAAKPRGQAEFEMLDQIRQIGGNAPEPVAFVRKGKILHHAWLVTKELSGVRALSEISLDAPDAARAAMPAVVQQIRLLVEHGIYHVDLHPGNVLVGRHNKAYLIDFDKARVSGCSRHTLRHRYIRRWARAAEKYGLPAFVTESVQAELMGDTRADPE